MLKRQCIILILSLFALQIFGQMSYNGKSVYGNEWIDQNTTYYKFKISTDGIYKINYQDLVTAGLPIQGISMDRISIYRLGEEIDIYTSTKGVMTSTDYIEFYGVQNRGELDQALFPNPVDQFNKEYSFFTDESVYYLAIKNTSSTHRINFINNDISNPLPKDQYFLAEQKIILTDQSNKRSRGSEGAEKFPDFDEGQGYSSGFQGEHKFSIKFANLYKNNIPASIQVVYSGQQEDDRAHIFEFYVNDVFADKDNFTGFKTRTINLNILPDDLTTTVELKCTAKETGGSADQIGISVIKAKYPHNFDFNNAKSFKLTIPSSSIRKYIEIENFDGGNTVQLYDLTNKIYLTADKSGSIYKFSLPPSVQDREIIISNVEEIKNITNFQKIEQVDYTKMDAQANYIILTSKKFLQTNQGTDAINDYVNYRKSSEGGAYKVNVVYTEDIYNQFGFGIEYHSIAIRNFFQYTRTIWPNVKFALFIGKGLHYAAARNNPTDQSTYMFVPTYGYPGADYLMVSDIARKPFYAMGRIPSLDGKGLLEYLSKVKGHESVIKNSSYSIKNREWIKRVIHLSGGEPKIYNVLRNQMDAMKEVIENNQFGASVTTFSKQSTAPIEIADIDALRKLVDGGVSMISFLGHSAAFRLDYNVEDVYSYNNKDKYHIFLAMGCYAGQMFENFKSVSEQFNLPPDRGSIIYLANTTAGIPSILGIATAEFYRLIGGRLYGATVGEIIKETNIELLKKPDEKTNTQALSITFNGDPAIRLHVNPDQDFTIDASTITTEPKSLFSSVDSFSLFFDIVNLGASFNDSLLVRIEQQLPNGTKQIVYEGNVASPVLRRNVEFKIPTQGDLGIGFNKLYVTLDPLNTINEGPKSIAEENNEIELSNGDKFYSYYLIGNDAKPVYPEEFSIVTQNFPTLMASNGNTLAPKSNYYFEIDTTEYFNSPLKAEKVNFQTGGIISWNTGIDLIPGKVYYWRVRPEVNASNVNAWRYSSFIYLPNASKGWNQSHYFQFIKDKFEGKEIKEPARVFDYSDELVDFKVLNCYVELPRLYYRPQIFLKDNYYMDYRYWELRDNVSSVLVSVFNPVNGELWKNKTGRDYGSDGTLGNVNYENATFFQFETNTKENRSDLINFLENVVTDDAVVVLHTLRQFSHSFYPEEWESDGAVNIYSVLNKYGATQVNELKTKGSMPYILVYRKNRPDFEVKEKIGGLTEQIEVLHNFKINKPEGKLHSTIIGPASSWERFLWNSNRVDQAEDNQFINIYGINKQGVETKLFGPFIDAEQDLRNIKVDDYPKLKLEWYSMDTFSRTAPNLDYWRIHYKGLPDITFNPSFLFTKNKDTLDQGEFFKMEMIAQNISDYDMDSLLVKYDLIDEKNASIISIKRMIPVKAQAGIKIPYEISTNGQSGIYKLIVELNPGQEQAETNYFNNVAIINYYVRGDNRNPLLDVVFDGIHIANEDIVSSKTKIQITLNDENAFLPLNDTGLFEIKIIYPDKKERKITFTEKDVMFIPPTPGGKNEAKIIICGDFNLDGIYELHVKAKDPSGNQVSSGNYIISFRIVNEQSVSNLLNYPNPFSDKTRFVYTLTGSELPSYYKIQIMSISGKVVREITQDQIGKLKIGTHMTDYEYNGTDDFGSKLANGVYLYRFVIKNSKGENFKKLNADKLNFESTDHFFKNDFGKLVILR